MPQRDDSSGHIILCTHDPRRHFERAVARNGLVDFVWCQDEAQFLSALREGLPRAIVWALPAGGNPDLRHVAAHLRATTPNIPLVIEVDLSRLATRQLLTMLDVRSPVYLSVRGVDKAEAILAEALDGHWYPQPLGEISNVLLPIVSTGQGRDMLAAAVVAGSRRLSVGDFASLCGVAERTLEWRFHEARLPAPRRVLGMMLSLHTLWRMGVLGWSVKRAALIAGFSSAKTLSRYVVRQVGVRPSQHASMDDFNLTLQRIVGEISRSLD